MNPTERSKAFALAMGRIFKLGSRPTQPGDAAEYARCRNLILDLAEEEGVDLSDHRPNYIRDRNKGAAGD